MEKNFNQNKKKGFSLMEVMLVVFILSTTLVVFIQVIASGMSHSMESRDTIIAAGLAQEGVELVKNVRDNNWAKKKEAFDRFSSNCIINYDYNPSSPCSSGPDWKLYLKGSVYYTHDPSGEATKFSRKIDILGGTDKKTVTSYVTWKEASFLNSVDTGNCNISNKCVYAQITLTKWGE